WAARYLAGAPLPVLAAAGEPAPISVQARTGSIAGRGVARTAAFVPATIDATLSFCAIAPATIHVAASIAATSAVPVASRLPVAVAPAVPAFAAVFARATRGPIAVFVPAAVL